MADDIECRERDDDLYCEVDGNEVHVSDLTKAQCQRTDSGEWLQGYDRVQDWSRVSSPETKRILKEALRNDVDLVKSMSQQDDPPIQPETAKAIQESYQPSVAGACRYGRDRAATQPDSYETEPVDETDTQTTESQEDFTESQEDITVEEAREAFEVEQTSLEDFGL
ncbi:hypothetical protein NP511_17825 [Natrinema thermotolerans]|uniref:Uncharacterized protein n=1 Tax=Natrinema thermotolerans TaxID=121872 RepID=A0AAF0T5C8_9EURY|nr:hypothetical protein [Natrinema thermotolerans]QCC60218.1 hypothetical protein DVR14_16910 [Natrinema thermotolerans]QCC61128.1 hypothetical protein DVR14_21030 [Natrinema thermotolerans]WMT07234.1 hypothetical protein NP511_17825 [Natrinema thermotolerans]